MPDDLSEDERRLRKLAEQTQVHWDEAQAATQSELEAVRKAVQEQWQHEQAIKERTRQTLQTAQQGQSELELKAQQEQRQQEEEKRRKDQSQGQGHGY